MRTRARETGGDLVEEWQGGIWLQGSLGEHPQMEAEWTEQGRRVAAVYDMGPSLGPDQPMWAFNRQILYVFNGSTFVRKKQQRVLANHQDTDLQVQYKEQRETLEEFTALQAELLAMRDRYWSGAFIPRMVAGFPAGANPSRCFWDSLTGIDREQATAVSIVSRTTFNCQFVRQEKGAKWHTHLDVTPMSIVEDSEEGNEAAAVGTTASQSPEEAKGAEECENGEETRP